MGSDQNVRGEFLREWSGCGVPCLLEGLPKLPGHGPGPPWSRGLDQMMSRGSLPTSTLLCICQKSQDPCLPYDRVKTKDFTLKTEVVVLTVAAVLLVGGWETFQRVSAKDTFLMVLWCLWIIISSLKSFFVRVVVLQSKWSWSTQRSWQMGVLKLELWKMGQNMQFHIKFWKQKDHFSVLG